MAISGVEVIDLTESAPQTPVPAAKVATRSIRRMKRPRTESSSTEGVTHTNTPIIISDGEVAPSPAVSSTSSKKRKPRKKRRKSSNLEDGEVAEEEPTRPGNEEQFNDSRDTHARLNNSLNESSTTPLFYLDDKPDILPESQLNSNHNADPDIGSESIKPNGLLLPDHVILDILPAGGAPVVTEASTLVESDTDDFILYADADLNSFARYYEEPKDKNERKAHLVCGQCGAEGDHKQQDCPVEVCLTCGAHNEHLTRQCPIVRTCFSCGMKGHINRDCPNKGDSRIIADRHYGCDRCGSNLHKTIECPTLWRMYEYLGDAERDATLKSRKEKEILPIGQGGEGFIGEDYWCYNCGGEGHLGDDCNVMPRPHDLKEPSAFGSFNTMTGPFADREYARSNAPKLRREWEIKGNFDDGHGFAGPSDVGKRGRDKERERMRLREKETNEVEEGEEDWFGSRLQPGARPRPLPTGPKSTRPNEKLVFDFQDKVKIKPSLDTRSPADRLLARISSGPAEKDTERGSKKTNYGKGSSSKDDHHRGLRRSDGDSKRDRERDRDGARDRDRERDRDRDRDRDYRDSRGDRYRPKKAADRSYRMRDHDDDRRQYYGGYAR